MRLSLQKINSITFKEVTAMKIFLFSTHSATASHRTEQENEPHHDGRSVNHPTAATEHTQPETQEETQCGDCT